IIAGRGFFGKHKRVGAVQDGVGNVRHFSAGRSRIPHHGAQHLRCRDHRLAQVVGFADHHLLYRRNALLGNFQSQVPTRHHDAVDVFKNAVEMVDGFVLFDFGDDRNRCAAALHLAPRVENILAVAHEGKRDHIDFLLDAEGEVLFVLVGERAYVQAGAGKVNALVRPENAANDDPAFNFVLAYLQRFEFDLAVTEQDRIAIFDDSGEAGEAHRNRQLASEQFPRRQHERVARLQSNPIAGDGADANFRARQVLKNRDGLFKLALELADLADDAPVKRVVAVTEIQPRYVHAGADQSFQHFVR